MNRREFVGLLGGGAVVRLRPDDQLVERWSWAMGQAVHVMVFAGSEQEGLDACGALLAELRRVEARLSVFDDASDLSELNRHAGRGPMVVNDDLRAVLAQAEACRRLTGGAFDAAVEPLMRVWGFRGGRRSPPSGPELAEAREAVATAVVDLDGRVARLPNAHTQLDFGGIGVGYGIDRGLAVLRARGIRRAFLDISGDCAALGAPPGAEGWSVAIADPRRPGCTIAQVSLRDAALATSANTVVEHVMDPATGRPARRLVQATVIARSGLAADVLAKGLFVSGRTSPGVLRAYEVA